MLSFKAFGHRPKVTEPRVKPAPPSMSAFTVLQDLTMALSSLSNVLRSFVLTLKTMTTPSPDPPINSFITPKENRTLDSMSWSALTLTPGPSLELTNSSHVTRAFYLKAKGDKEHEVFFMEVQLPSTQKTFIHTDRCPKRFGSEPPTPSRSPAPPAPNASDPGMIPESSNGFLTSSGKARADDRVFINGTHHGHSSIDVYIAARGDTYDVIGEWKFDPPIPLSHAAIAIATVTEHSVNYEPLGHQCYWYAESVLSLLLRMQPSMEKSAQFKSKQGTYFGIPIRQEDSLETLGAQFDTKLRAYIKHGKLLKEEERKKLEQVWV